MSYSQEDVDRYRWFHGLDFGNGLVAKGRGEPENWSLYGTLSFLESLPLAGVRLLDVGTMDGLVSFIAEKEGASVVATDLYDRDSLRLAKRIFESSVEYHPSTSIEDLMGKFGPASFDVVVMGGLLYHLVSPLRAILIARSLLKTGGVAILETVATEQREPTLLFNLGDPVIDEYTTYFVPSISAVREMMRFCNFQIMGSNKVRPSGKNYVRGTVMGRAVEPSQAESSTELMRTAQVRAAKGANDRILDEFNFATLVGAPQTRLAAHLDGSEDEIEIDKGRFETRFPVQPKRRSQ